MMSIRTLRAVLLASVALGLGACNTAERLAAAGQSPEQSRMLNPAAFQPNVNMPMPAEPAVDRPPNSLWRPGARAFLSDQRASRVGDILTVTINVADAAQIQNTTARSRTNTENAQGQGMLGYELIWNRILPGQTGSANPAALLNTGSSNSNQGAGSVNRAETVTMLLAATVTQVLPNGNLVIQGSQEMRVNFENRVLQIAGVIRPQDVRSDNQVPYDRIAEARISYGGRGQITDVQQPRWGSQVLDAIFPF
jgi:flagellar L-ring protein precursor FlgH